MDAESQKLLDNILKKEKRELNSWEIAFLRARRSYLNEGQLEEYKDILETKPSQEAGKYAKTKKGK